MTGLFDGSDLDEVLDTLAEIEDDDLDLILAGFRNIAHRARTGQLDLNLTQVLIAALAASPDSADLIGACAITLTDITEHNPSLDQVTEDARKEAISEAQQASSRLHDKYLREPASRACAALDARREANPLTDTERQELLSRKVANANHRSTHRPQ